MRVYTLTSVGTQLARSRKNTNTPAWLIIHKLDAAGSATDERLMELTGLNKREFASAMITLKSKKAINEIG